MPYCRKVGVERSTETEEDDEKRAEQTEAGG